MNGNVHVDRETTFLSRLAFSVLCYNSQFVGLIFLESRIEIGNQPVMLQNLSQAGKAIFETTFIVVGNVCKVSRFHIVSFEQLLSFWFFVQSIERVSVMNYKISVPRTSANILPGRPIEIFFSNLVHQLKQVVLFRLSRKSFRKTEAAIQITLNSSQSKAPACDQI